MTRIPGWARMAGYLDAWPLAIREHDEGKPDKLAELLASDLEITPEARAVVAEIVAGKRKFDRRGQHRAKITPAREREAVRDLEHLREIRDMYLEDAGKIAEKRQREPAEVRAWVERHYRKGVAALAARYGISARTLENKAKPSPAR